MNVLIVESNESLAVLWTRHLQRMGADVRVATGQEGAIAILQQHKIDVIVLDLVLSEGSAIAIADFASYRQPKTRVVFVTSTTFFSDGSIFNVVPNAAAFVKAQTPPEDLAAIVEHYGQVH